MPDAHEELDRLRELARRVYYSDGSWESLDTPEEVVRVRIETAREAERLRDLIDQIKDLIGELDSA